MKSETHHRIKHTRRYLIVGVLTAAPLWVTWLVFDFIFSQLSKMGAPWVVALARATRGNSQVLADLLLLPGFQSLLGVVFTLLVFYVLGWVATQVIGQRVIGWLERLVQSIPLVAAIYGGTKRFLTAVKEKPAGVQRVVLIAFPSPDMKAVGFVTRVIRDEVTGEELAAVYVPTSPNPTSGYIEIVPVSQVVSTDWTMDEAMSFVMTGGATSPDRIRFRNPASTVGAGGADSAMKSGPGAVS
ncbi:MAG: hypothetical protein CVU28_01925 [Betaproteobacteria bacterium HGW-Betaproteobacteria-21]|nr:MAG: hypothetical protein CVU28_01925 [Betaproteobacteria bacterium HGW-Betaproteobacteria-21]